MRRTAEPRDRDVRPEPPWRRGERVDSANRVRDPGGQRRERAVHVVELGGGEACPVRRGTGHDTPDSHARRRPGERRDEPVAKRRPSVDRHRAEERQGQVEVSGGLLRTAAAAELVAEGRQGVRRSEGRSSATNSRFAARSGSMRRAYARAWCRVSRRAVSGRSRFCADHDSGPAAARCADGGAPRSATGAGSPRGCRGSGARP